jgi:hypothetical protein
MKTYYVIKDDRCLCKFEDELEAKQYAKNLNASKIEAHEE